MAVIALSGWIKKEDYRADNHFFKHDISVSHTDPSTKHIMEACVSENDADKHVSNLKVRHIPLNETSDSTVDF